MCRRPVSRDPSRRPSGRRYFRWLGRCYRSSQASVVRTRSGSTSRSSSLRSLSPRRRPMTRSRALDRRRSWLLRGGAPGSGKTASAYSMVPEAGCPLNLHGGSEPSDSNAPLGHHDRDAARGVEAETDKISLTLREAVVRFERRASADEHRDQDPGHLGRLLVLCARRPRHSAIGRLFGLSTSAAGPSPDGGGAGRVRCCVLAPAPS